MISLVLPAYDEEEAITAVIADAHRALTEAGIDGFEVIVVDDGSTDRTAELAKESGARVISHPHNIGYGRSLKTGIRAARHDTIVICDADGSYPLDRIADLVSEFGRGFDMVVGARENYRESIWKAPLRRILKWLVEFTVGQRIPDVNSGLRVFSKRTSIPYFPTLCDTFSFTTSLTLAYMMSKRFVAHVAVPYAERKGQTKVRMLRDSLRTLQYIVQAILYYNSLKIFVLLSALCCLLGLVAFGSWLAFGWSLGIPAAVASLLTAILVFSLGLVADLVRTTTR